ncbi:hypothetical protein AMATHDRAFT_62388 [Amanita thiersii Skay4041]|uniref:Uncharacterized protein n=1 Tax=Amanita thiersii Skay4041 TaxID=703135 RepID=A0A2A9NQ19_9AGAR|nr:hypothetical protein AMATHDRAFT_62388 [Amanita thiersii Skay4041]
MTAHQKTHDTPRRRTSSASSVIGKIENKSENGSEPWPRIKITHCDTVRVGKAGGRCEDD